VAVFVGFVPWIVYRVLVGDTGSVGLAAIVSKSYSARVLREAVAAAAGAAGARAGR
jgi:hypothetical protein